MSPDDEYLCLLCGAPVRPYGVQGMTCTTCGVDYDITDRGLKISHDDYAAVFDGPPRGQYLDMPIRPHLVRAVRDRLHDFVTGAHDVPDERLRLLVALLLDIHCHQEGVVIGLARTADRVPFFPRPSIPRPQPRYPYPPPRKPFGGGRQR